MKKYKFFLSSLAAIVLTFSLLSGCFTKKTPDTTLQNKDITIGFSFHGLDMARWKREKIMAEEYAKEKGFNLLVTDAQKKPEKQIEQCENLISQGIDALIIIPEDDNSAGKIAQKAKENNVPLIAYDRLIRNAHISYYVNFDQTKVGRLQAEILTEKYPEGNYVQLKGASNDFNTTYFTNGNMQVLDEYIKSGKIKLIVSEFIPGWYRTESYKIMKNILKERTDITAVLVQNDDNARAVIQALEEAGLAGKVGVSGQDADLESIKYILQDKQTMTVYKPLKIMNTVALDFALKLAKGQIPETNGFSDNGYMKVPTFFIDVISVTKDNIDSTVIKDGFYTRKQVYGK